MSKEKWICAYTDCTGCGACVQACPKECISMKENAEGFLYPWIDMEKCVQCGKCRTVCPSSKEFPVNKMVFYMGWHKEKDVLLKSSSGGMFTAAADAMFDFGGVVVGAMLSEEDRKVRHIIIEDPNDLYLLRKSKYYQSDTGLVYKQVKGYLEENRYVLFTGTACQVAALYSFLGGKDEHLITMDVLCHGVSSKKVVDEYIRSKEKRYKKAILRYSFRVKCDGCDQVVWNAGMKLDFLDGTHVIEDKECDTFFRAFNTNICLRESCYNCHYCGVNRVADITAADFWGVNIEKLPKDQEKMGVSLVLISQTLPEQMERKLRDKLYLEEIHPEEAIPYNLALTKPNDKPEKRHAFFERLGQCDFDTLVKRLDPSFYAKAYIRKRIIGEKRWRRMKSMIKRF